MRFFSTVLSILTICTLSVFQVQAQSVSNECKELENVIESLIIRETEYEIDSVINICNLAIEKECPCLPQAYNLIGFVHYNSSNFNTAMKYLLKAENAYLKSQTDYRSYALNNHIYKGLILLVEKKLESCSFHFTRALELAKATDNVRLTAFAYMNLGIAKFDMDDVEGAASLFNKAISTKTTDLELTAYAHMNLGRTLLAQNQLDKALKEVENSKRLWNILGIDKGKYLLSIHESKIYVHLNQLEKALDVLLTGREIIKVKSIKLLLGENYLLEAKIHRKLNNTEEELIAINNALANASDLKSIEVKEAVERINSFSDKDQYEQTIASLLDMVENYRVESELSSQNEVEKLKLLENESDQKESIEKSNIENIKTIKSQNIILILLFTFFVILSALLFRFVKQKKMIASLNANLVDSFKQIEEKNNDLFEQKIVLETQVKSKLNLLANNQNIFEQINQLVNEDKEIPYGTKKEISSIIKSERNQKILGDIEFQMFEIHEKFFANLSRKHPNLTNNNLKLCLYLKMNLSTKEIASLMFSSVDSVKVARSRLRKKMDLKSKAVKLSSYLNSIGE